MATVEHPQKTAWWNNAHNRALLFQILLAIGVSVFFAFIANNTIHNLEQRGISTGFAFLKQKAGFGIIQHLIPYTENDTYGRTFIVGLLNTILVSVLGIICATVLGFIVGVARLSSNWLVSKLAGIYIETFRNLPLLLQIFFWYFAVLRALPSPRNSLHIGEKFFLNIRGVYLPNPIFEQGFGWVEGALILAVLASIILKRWANKRQEETGEQFPVLWTASGLILVLPTIAYFATGGPISWEYPVLKGFNFQGGITIIPELAALLIALSVYTASLIAEIVRSGILSVSHGQTEAAAALGLRPGKILRLVIIPQAMRVIIPQMTSQYLNLVKNSSLATAIGYPDLVAIFAGTTLNQTGQAIEVIAMTMAVYLTISLIISYFMNWYNARSQLRER
ncbi:MAG TPA: amino acid ABC transporter permease [Desulfobulbaceae bacterium]|nr:amino acid ABC transporter permease [Desulfobulbaceae bacterium]